MADTIQVNLKQVNKLAEKADQIFLDSKAEDQILKLLKLRDKIDNAINDAKKRLENTALKINKDFSSIQGDKIKVYYRSYGNRYFIDESRLQEIDKSFYKKIVKYTANAKEIELWIKEHKGMPVGIKENDRPKQLSIIIKNGEK